MAGLAPTATVRPHITGIHGYKYLKSMPEKNDLVPYKILSFDIEASSSHGDFPLAKKNYLR